VILSRYLQEGDLQRIRRIMERTRSFTSDGEGGDPRQGLASIRPIPLQIAHYRALAPATSSA
jgi:hypothetical protein